MPLIITAMSYSVYVGVFICFGGFFGESIKYRLYSAKETFEIENKTENKCSMKLMLVRTWTVGPFKSTVRYARGTQCSVAMIGRKYGKQRSLGSYCSKGNTTKGCPLFYSYLSPQYTCELQFRG